MFPGPVYRKVLNDAAKTRLVDNMVGHMQHARVDLQSRQLSVIKKADADWARRVHAGLLKAAAASGKPAPTL